MESLTRIDCNKMDHRQIQEACTEGLITLHHPRADRMVSQHRLRGDGAKTRPSPFTILAYRKTL